MAQLLKSEGIILHTLMFRDYDHIITLFTQNEGLIKLFLKGSKKRNMQPSPFTQGEFIYLHGKSDLHRSREISIINSHLPLRERFQSIEAACQMATAIQQTQMPHKGAPHLYALLMSYLKKIPEFTHPEVLAASFQLKILRYEGLLAPDEEIDNNDFLTLAYSRSFDELQKITLSSSIKELIQALYQERVDH